MNIAIVHYHLNRGGVTQVIANHLRSLDAVVDRSDGYRVALLHGGRTEGWPADLAAQLSSIPLRIAEVRGLDYDTDGTGGRRMGERELADALRSTFERLDFPAATTVVHVHNHALGKNLALPGSLRILAQQGYRLLLEVHDFAEDFRPHLYGRLCRALAGGDPERLSGRLYPQAPHIHYAVLNARDHTILAGAGFAAGRLHRLPNPVPPLPPLPDHDVARARLAARWGIPRDRPLLVYPVRGIARKNLGELLLWSALAGPRAYLATTLPPLNPEQQAAYRRWRSLAERFALPCAFEIGGSGGLSFPENLAAADRLITTSLVEGFGMVFLESWLAARPLVGRDLPEITVDFKEEGIDLSRLSPELRVPIDGVGKEAFRQEMAAAYRAVLARYGRRGPPEAGLAEAIDGLVVDGQVDFGYLTAERQAALIEWVCADPRRCEGLLEKNAWLGASLAEGDAAERALVERNRGVVRERYGPFGSGRRLLDVYRQVVQSDRGGPPTAPPHGTAILDRFLSLPRFRPVAGAL